MSQLTQGTTTGQTQPPAPQPPGAQPPPAQEGKTATLDLGSGTSMVLGSFALIPALFALVFALGASYLSYQKYGSAGWAILDFFFPYIYYPYYAFVVSREPTPVPATMFGGKRNLAKVLFGKWLK